MKKNLLKCFVLAILAGSVSLAGCTYLEPETDRIGSIDAPAENSILLCSDGLDNDKDGLVDCDDPDCKQKGTVDIPGPGDTICAGVIGDNKTENNNYVCSDGIDNDGDGFVDCNDNSCKQLPVCCVKTGNENTIEACSDGIDNDCDGYMDCKDYSCTRTTSNNPNDPGVVDQSVVDFCKSINCPVIGVENTVESCSDGMDNDCNGYIDCNDHSCSKSTDPAVKAVCAAARPVSPENSEEACSDKVDNDLNGLIDCAEAECRAIANHCKGITEEPAPRPGNFATLSSFDKLEILRKEFIACTDGVDNDKDSLIDCQEYQCHLLSLQKLTGEFAEFQITCQ